MRIALERPFQWCTYIIFFCDISKSIKFDKTKALCFFFLSSESELFWYLCEGHQKSFVQLKYAFGDHSNDLVRSEFLMRQNPSKIGWYTKDNLVLKIGHFLLL